MYLPFSETLYICTSHQILLCQPVGFTAIRPIPADLGQDLGGVALYRGGESVDLVIQGGTRPVFIVIEIEYVLNRLISALTGYFEPEMVILSADTPLPSNFLQTSLM